MSALRVCTPLLLLFPLSAVAQVVERTDAKAQDQVSSRWSAGLAVVHRDSEYAGEGTRTRLLPNIAYDGDRFYLRGAAFGYRVHTDERIELRAFVAGRLESFCPLRMLSIENSSSPALSSGTASPLPGRMHFVSTRGLLGPSFSSWRWLRARSTGRPLFPEGRPANDA